MEARNECQRSFPYGWDRVPTSTEKLRCGVHALRESMMAQHPDLPAPDVDDLDGLTQSDEAKEFNEQSEFESLNNDTSNFRFDQLAAAIQQWGRPHGLNLQLGVLIQGMNPFLFPVPDGNAISVWITNDNMQAENIFGHYEGLRPRTALEAEIAPPVHTAVPWGSACQRPPVTEPQPSKSDGAYQAPHTMEPQPAPAFGTGGHFSGRPAPTSWSLESEIGNNGFTTPTVSAVSQERPAHLSLPWRSRCRPCNAFGTPAVGATSQERPGRVSSPWQSRCQPRNAFGTPAVGAASQERPGRVSSPWRIRSELSNRISASAVGAASQERPGRVSSPWRLRSGLNERLSTPAVGAAPRVLGRTTSMSPAVPQFNDMSVTGTDWRAGPAPSITRTPLPSGRATPLPLPTTPPRSPSPDSSSSSAAKHLPSDNSTNKDG